MKTSAFIIFLSVVLVIYSLVNYYIFIRGWQALPKEGSWRTFYLGIFIPVSLAYIFGRILERLWMSYLSDALMWIGSFWMAFMLYFFLFVVLLDFSRLLNHFFSIYPSFITNNYLTVKRITLFASFGLVFIIVMVGHLNAIFPRVRNMEVKIHKKVEGQKAIKMIVASDVHLGTIIGSHRFERIIKKINALKPDLVVFAGDLFDEDLGPVIRKNLGEMLTDIKAPMGIYAITGNHEYIGGVEEAVKYMTEHKVTVLRDTTLKINNNFYLIGRDDKDKQRFTGTERKKLEDLLQNVDKTFPLILFDHQPFKLHQAADNGIDLQISGHTHNGQMWPFNYMINSIYELAWGYKKIKQTAFYVSCGLGTWGPPVRLGSKPEIVNFSLIFD